MNTFNIRLGHLEYRGLKFETERLEQEKLPGCSSNELYRQRNALYQNNRTQTL